MLVAIALLNKHIHLSPQLILRILAPLLERPVIFLDLLQHAVQSVVLDCQFLNGLPALVDLSLKRCEFADGVVLSDIIESKLPILTSESVDVFIHFPEVVGGGGYIFGVLLVFLPGAGHLFFKGEDVVVEELDLLGVGFDRYH